MARLARAATAPGLGVPRRSKAPAAKAVGESGRGFAALFVRASPANFQAAGFPRARALMRSVGGEPPRGSPSPAA